MEFKATRALRFNEARTTKNSIYYYDQYILAVENIGSLNINTGTTLLLKTIAN